MSAQTLEGLPAGARQSKAPTTERRHEAGHRFLIDGNVDDVFGLLDPVSEREWVDDWDPTPIWPATLSREAGTVFSLQRDGRTAIWTILQHSPLEHCCEFLVTEYDYQHRWIRVTCQALDTKTTQVKVKYVTTALSAAGQRDIGRYGEEFLKAWQVPIQQAVNSLTRTR